MRIVVGSISHESNSFNPTLTELKEFRPLYGPEMLAVPERLARSSLQGIIQVIQEHGAQVIPSVFARACPGGLVSPAAYGTFKDALLDAIRQAGAIDGVCLALHGSMTVAGLGDGEGDLLRSIRHIIGPDIPIVCALDMHAIVTEEMVTHANAFAGYRTAPHVDAVETGMRAGRLLMGSLGEGYSLRMAAVQLPILVSGEQSESAKPPMAALIEQLGETDQIDGVLDSSFFLGFPWVDVSYNQGSALVVCQDDAQLAISQAVKLAEALWAARHKFVFTTEAYPIERCLRIARSEIRGPVCIADCCDNPGAGGATDITAPLASMLSLGVERALAGVIADQAAYALCERSGVGSRVQLALGKTDVHPDAPALHVEGEVTLVGLLEQAPAAVVALGGVDVIISAERVMMLDPASLGELGVNPTSYHTIVIKSGYLDPKYEAIASRGMLALAPGYTNQVFTDLDYQQVPRPIYPLDNDFVFRPHNCVMKGR